MKIHKTTTPLGIRTKIFCGLNEDYKRRLGALEAWNLDFVRRQMKLARDMDNQILELLEKEYRKFISLSVMFPDMTFGMAGDVDEFWHAHILFTENYMSFCKSVSDRYIHHHPHVGEDSESENAYVYHTVPYLRNVYGCLEKRAWPIYSSLKYSKCGGGKCGCRNAAIASN